MDADSDNDAGFEVGRRRPSLTSSRESSPAAKRQKRSFTPPASDDGNLVVPVAHTPTPDNAPLIRQAVAFSSIGTNVNTYQATVAPQPVVPHFLPGQAPPPPPKPRPKPSKPRAPRKKKGEQFSSQTSKFKLTYAASSPDSGFTARSTASPADTSLSQSPAPMIPVSSYLSGYADDRATASPSDVDNGLGPDVRRARKSTKRKAPGVAHRQAAPATVQHTFNPSPGAPPVERVGSHQRTRSMTPRPDSRSAPVGAGRLTTQNPAQWSLRRIILLIEDLRNGAPDLQRAEVNVPLTVASDPEDGFWTDALDVVDALQGGPSRIDGPARMYTIRGMFRQFFMRIEEWGELRAQSAHLAVSKNRTMNVFVETPGQPPRPVPPSDVRPGYSSGSDATVAGHSEPYHRPAYSLVTREDQIERLSKSNYAVAPRRRYSPDSDGGSYGHSRRTAPPHKAPRHDRRASPSRVLTPPIPGRYADTQEERDDAIANYIRSPIENHAGWTEYMQSKAKPQRVSEVLKQYAFVEDRVSEHTGRRTPAHWDGAPSSYVERYHVWRVLKLDPEWGEECREALLLVRFYGKDGSRYEDSRVVDMINDTSPPRPDTMQRFLRLLRNVNEAFTHDTLRGQLIPASP